MAELNAELFPNCFVGNWTLLSIALIALILLATASGASGAATENPAPQLPKEKQTTLRLYVTAKEAYEKWKAEPDKVKILDVRTSEEYIFVGHTAMAMNIPVAVQTYEWDEDKKQFPIKPNPDFVSAVKEWAKSADTIMVMCRSGGRSALAVNTLAEAGFKNVYNITDGMEGDTVSDPDSVYNGQRLRNGWKNSGCPWTYKVSPDRMVLPKAR